MVNHLKKGALLMLILPVITGCGPGESPATAPPAIEAQATPEATPEPTEPPQLDSVRMPEVASAETIIVYEQAQRATLDGADTFFWPDGNLGFIPYEGEYRFFAANSVLTARTRGTLENPGAVVENASQRIVGADPEFAYLAGGPIYTDPESGMLIMFYHAERHLANSSGTIFHAALGLAASHDQGVTFENLGIILETNATPSATARCCADMAGAPFAVKDGMFYLYFRDRKGTRDTLRDVQLAVAIAPVDEVVAAARNGTTSEWRKYNYGDWEPGLGGESSPLEVGNPMTSWFSVSYNTLLDQFLMVIAAHPGGGQPSTLSLITSPDGFNWSPRVTLVTTPNELTYPSIIDPGGDPLTTGDSLYIYYVTTPPEEVYRWHNTTLHRMTVSLTGQMVELPHEWEFDTDAGGWTVINAIDRFEVVAGVLMIQPTSNDPYIESPSLGISTQVYSTIEVRMKVGQSGVGQFFFTTDSASDYSEAHSLRFDVTAGDDFVTYTLDLSSNAGWEGLLGRLRFDPIDQTTPVEIDAIRILP